MQGFIHESFQICKKTGFESEKCPNLGRSSLFARSDLDPSPSYPSPRASLRQLPRVQAALSVNAHAVLARFCMSKSLTRCSTAVAKAANNCVSGWPAVANAHAVLVDYCMLKSLTRCSTTLAKAANNCASDWPAVANTHAVLARSWI